MNAPLPASEIHALGSLDEFAECCEIQVWFRDNGWVSLHTAVDNLQRLAELWLLVEEYGQDVVQAIMADAFAPREAEPEIDLPSDYAADAWSLTGDRPPTDAIRNSAIFEPVFRPRRFSPPKATIDAFKYVVALGDPEYLAKWLRDHSDVAPVLLKQLPEAA
jgi:hypothetical protein